jgi:hypothetical protein
MEEEEVLMERKPWPIVILAVLHFLEPIAKILFYTTLWHMPIPRFLSFMIHHTTTPELLLFLAAFPVGGVCIIAVKKWSFYGYLAIQALTLFGHIHYHLIAPQAFPISLIAGMTALNLIVVGYFLLPAVRLAYMDPKVRWWEAKPRYLVDFVGKALQGHRSTDLKVSNISEGGLFVTVANKVATLESSEPVQVEFDFLGTPYSLVGQIRHHSSGATEARYGVQFAELTPGVQAGLRKSMRKLRRLKYKRQGRSEDAMVSFKKWIRILFTTGRGLLPEARRPAPQKKEETNPLRKTGNDQS